MTNHAIDRGTLQALSVRSRLMPLIDAVLVWGTIALVMTASILADRWYVYALAVLVIGARQNALATLAHEGWHGLLFSSHRVNHGVGAWFYAYPIGILYYHDRERHLRHHREVGSESDPDWINYASHRRDSPLRVLLYLASLLLGRLFLGTLLSFVRRGSPRIGIEPVDTAARENRPGVLRELACAVLAQAFLFAVITLSAANVWAYFVLWVLPLATVAGFFANFRALIEHVTARDGVPPQERLRDIRAGLPERFFLAPSHFNFHALHHAHPSIPHYNLVRGKRIYEERLGAYPFAVWPGYTSALFAHLKELRRKT